MTLLQDKMLAYLFPASQTTAAYGKNKELKSGLQLKPAARQLSLIWEQSELDKRSLKRHEHLDRAED